MSLGVHPSALSHSSASIHKGLRPSGEIAVCHVASGDLWAGAEVQLASLLSGLAGKPEIRLAVILLNEGKLASAVRALGIELRVIPETKNGFFTILAEATRFLRGKSIRVLHSHRNKENLLAALLAWRCDVPHVVRTQHGLPEPFSGLRRQIKQSALLCLDGWLARHATDRVISVSGDLHDRLVRRLGSDKVALIRNGLDFTHVHSDLNLGEAKARLGIPQDCPVVGYAGRLEPIKRLDILIAMTKAIASYYPNIMCVIAGEGSQTAELRELANGYGLEEQVEFLGHREDVYDVLRAFDVFVLPSDHEGLPMVLLEALYLGVPVVARAVGGIPEVIENGFNGLLVNSSDPGLLAQASLQVLSDRIRAQQLAKAGIETVKGKFDAEQAADHTAQLYFSLVSPI